jgi:hypothetical protein
MLVARLMAKTVVTEVYAYVLTQPTSNPQPLQLLDTAEEKVTPFPLEEYLELGSGE